MLKLLVTTVDSSEVTTLKINDQEEILATLGGDKDKFAIQLQEILDSVTRAIIPNIQVESQLTVEITGTISLKTQGGINYMLFNVGAEAASLNTMKVSLSTKLIPIQQTS